MTREEFAAMTARGPVFLDGATGSNLMKAGMPRGVCTEAWILEHPQVLLELQRAYVAAGSQIIYAPTFGANRHSLGRHGLASRAGEMNRALVALSREAAEGKALVAGDMTTTGEPMEPEGSMSYDALFDLYCDQARSLRDGGADLLVVETMLSVDETAAALEACLHVCDLPVLCSLSVQADGTAYFGGSCTEAVETLQVLGASCVGVNCSCGPEQLLSAVRAMKKLACVPVLAKPNAGMPRILSSGEVVYPMGPEEFAAHMKELHEAGAAVLGGCCGTDPRFIAAMKKILM